MATKTFNNGVYNNAVAKTVTSSLSLSGANNDVVLVTAGNVTSLDAFALLYDTQTVLGPARSVTLSKDGDNTTFTTKLTAANTEMAIVDVNGLTVTFTLTSSANTTVFPDLTGSVDAVGPNHRRKRHLGY